MAVLTTNLDNRTFIRYVTAAITDDSLGPLPINYQLKWQFPAYVTAITDTFSTVTSLSTVNAVDASTLYLSFSASTYDHTTTLYTICALPLTATILDGTLTDPPTFEPDPGIFFDTWPTVNINLYLNNEFTFNSPYFFRSTAGDYIDDEGHKHNIFSGNFKSSSFDSTQGIPDNPNEYYTYYYWINNDLPYSDYFQNIPDFNCTVPCVCTLNLTISAKAGLDSLYEFYTPHIFTQSISARYVPYFPKANVIGFPDSYFLSGAFLQASDYTINSFNNDYLKNSTGMSFYGEGHTGGIFLSASSTNNNVKNYKWFLNDSSTLSSIDNSFRYSTSAAIIPALYTPNVQPLTSLYISISTTPALNLTLPILLQVDDGKIYFNVDKDPIISYSDNYNSTLGEGTVGYFPVYYPYCTSTVDATGTELITNTPLFQSIQVKPYDPIQYTFTPGIDPLIYLPVAGSVVTYNANLKLATSTFNELSACYDKYGLLWKWSTFENYVSGLGPGLVSTPISGIFTNTKEPSSWASLQCLLSSGSTTTAAKSGKYTKKWRNEGVVNPIFNTVNYNTPVTYTVDKDVNWYVETPYWKTTTVQSSSINTFVYKLFLNDYGEKTLASGGALSFYNDEKVTIRAKQTFTAHISTTQISDWITRDLTLNAFYSLTSIAPPQIKYYTSNRYVLTGTDVFFENQSTNLNTVTAININFNEVVTNGTSNLILTGNQVYGPFSVNFNTEGFKTITVTFYTSKYNIPIIQQYTNIVRVLNHYDTVAPEEYRIDGAPIVLPNPNKPIIGSNDWVTSDNINSCVEKIYDNLQYLNVLGRHYLNKISDYYGYLGQLPTKIGPLDSCPIWTWESLSLDALDKPDEMVTWEQALKGDAIQAAFGYNYDYIGKYVKCGTWIDQACNTGLGTNLTCLGKYCTDWNWNLKRSKNSSKIVTWNDTLASKPYNKKWVYEPCSEQNQNTIICNSGIWNVNIPKLDTFYYNLPNHRVLNICKYTGIASRNNFIYASTQTQINILSSNYTSTVVSSRYTVDGNINFQDIKNICIDSTNKIYVLDNILSRVAVLKYDTTLNTHWVLFNTWGGYGIAGSKTKFNRPNDIHIDQLDNVWICDTGNKVVKQFSNSGTWIQTINDNNFKLHPPLSLTVDSQQNVHVLTNTSVFVYDYTGNFKFSYSYNDYLPSEFTGSYDIFVSPNSRSTPTQITNAYNREIIYVIFNRTVLKFLEMVYLQVYL